MTSAKHIADKLSPELSGAASFGPGSRPSDGAEQVVSTLPGFDPSRVDLAATEAERCETCGGLLTWTHDHRSDQSGLDDGPYLPGCAPRKKRSVDAATFSAERKRGWETRRVKYGPRGHR